MAQWQRVGFQTQRLGVRIPLASYIFFFFNKKKCEQKRIAETGNRTQAAAATTRSPATRLFRRLEVNGGSGYRSRFSTLRRLYATMYNNPPCASIGTRTRILSLEGINTTLVLWTLVTCTFHETITRNLSTATNLFTKKKRIREGRFELPTKGSPRRLIHTLQSSALPLSYPRLFF